MTDGELAGGRTEVSRVIKAPRDAVFRAFMDGDTLAKWLAPSGMTGHIHTFEPRVGGTIRMSLTYLNVAESPDGRGGKSSEATDTFTGRILEVVPDSKIVWATVFESADPDFAGEMRLTWSLSDVSGGTAVTVLCENIPRGIRPEDNETGSRESLANLAAMFEEAAGSA